MLNSQDAITTHSRPRVSPEIVVWIYDTLDNNWEIKNDFTNISRRDVLLLYSILIILFQIMP